MRFDVFVEPVELAEAFAFHPVARTFGHLDHIEHHLRASRIVHRLDIIDGDGDGRWLGRCRDLTRICIRLWAGW